MIAVRNGRSPTPFGGLDLCDETQFPRAGGLCNLGGEVIFETRRGQDS